MSELIENSRGKTIAGFLLALPGVALLALIMLKIDPPLGPLAPFLTGPPEGAHVLGSVVAITLIVVLPLIGLALNAAVFRTKFFAVRNVLIAAGIGLLMIAPFAILQMVNKSRPSDEFPLAMFAVIWLLSTAFVAILMSMIGQLRGANAVHPQPAKLVLGAVVLLILGSMWIGIINDQMPCFMGVPNCD